MVERPVNANALETKKMTTMTKSGPHDFFVGHSKFSYM